MGMLNIIYHAEHKASRRHLREYHRAINEQELGERNRQGESPGKGYIRAGRKSLITDSLRASIPPSENMAYELVFPAPTTCTL